MNERINFSGEGTINRANETRRDTDTFKTPAISIYDVDFAIMHYIRHTIDLQVEQNNHMVTVPLVYAKAELWNQIQLRGYMRDRDGKLLVPYAVIRRTAMIEDDRFKKLDVNNPPISTNLRITQNPPRNFENFRDLHSSTTNSSPAEEFFISVMPEFYKVEYELVIYTAFIEQMNKLVQDLMVASNFMWGDSYQFRTLVGDFEFDTVNPSSQERIIRTTVPLTVDARLQNEFELRKSTIQKAFSIKRVVFRNERSSFDIYVDEKIPNQE